MKYIKRSMRAEYRKCEFNIFSDVTSQLANDSLSIKQDIRVEGPSVWIRRGRTAALHAQILVLCNLLCTMNFVNFSFKKIIIMSWMSLSAQMSQNCFYKRFT